MKPRVLALLVGLCAACSSAPEPASLLNFTSPLPGIYTAGQPTDAQLRALPGIGITRVVQLRPANERGTGWEEERATEIGLDFVRIPVAGKQGLTRTNAQRLADELARPTDAGVLICCRSSNRVGALLALKAVWLDGLTREEALTIGREGGMTKIEPHVVKLLDPDR